MEFFELDKRVPILQRELLGGVKTSEYSCTIYKNSDGPFFIVRINDREFMVRVGSIFRTIIDVAKIKPLQKVKNENHISDGSEGRSKNHKESDRVRAPHSG